MRNALGFSWSVLLFTISGLWLACYAFALAFEAPVRRWDEEGES